MSKRDKLIERFKGKPKDFTWQEMIRLLSYFDFEEIHGSGSRRRFINKERQKIIFLHEPHPSKIILSCYMNDVYDTLKEEAFI